MTKQLEKWLIIFRVHNADDELLMLTYAAFKAAEPHAEMQCKRVLDALRYAEGEGFVVGTMSLVPNEFSLSSYESEHGPMMTCAFDSDTRLFEVSDVSVRDFFNQKATQAA